MKALVLAASVIAASALALQGCATTAALIPIGTGERVLAKWQPIDPYWYPGTVSSRSGDDLSIMYGDGQSAVQRAGNVRRFDWKNGMHLECQWTDNNWYRAVVTEMDATRTKIKVRYEDGSAEETKTDKCRVA